MKIIKYLVNGATAVALACSFAACGGDDEDEPEGGNGGNNGDNPGWVDPGTGPVLTDEEAKDYLEATANMVMDKLDPEDQRHIVDLVGNFCEDYKDYSLEGYEDDYEDEYRGVARKSHDSRGLISFFRNLRLSVAKCDYMMLSRMAEDVIRFSDFTGIYEPDADRKLFCYKGKSDDLVVKFHNAGAPCEVKVSRVGNGSWSMDLTGATEGEFSSAEVPDNLRFSLTENGSELLGGTVESRWDANAVKLKADVAVMNIRVKADFNATNSEAVSHEELYIDGSLLQTSDATVRGNNMVNPDMIAGIFDEIVDRWEYAPGYFEEEIYYEFNPAKAANLFRSAEANTILLGRMKVVTSLKDSKDFLGLETYFDSYDYDGDENAAKRDCQQACNVLTNSAPTYLYLAGNDQATAQLKWQPRFEEDGYGYGYWWWEPEGIIEFSDGSRYNVEDYALDGFVDLQSRIGSLVGAYVGLWNAAFK